MYIEDKSNGLEGPGRIGRVTISKTGKLTLIQNEPTQGKTPRHFAIDPTGQWLLAESQNSDGVVVFVVDPATGKLRQSGQRLHVGSPVCAVFVRAK